MKRILCATDFSGTSEAAVATAERLAGSLGAELLFLHVTTDGPMWREGLPPSVGKVMEAQREWVAKELGARVATLAATGVTARALVKTGTAWDEIVQTARDEGADLIVMGTEGRTGLNRMLIGSVAENVVRHAGCPVMTVRARESEAKGDTRCA
jgi:universal stress protein A